MPANTQLENNVRVKVREELHPAILSSTTPTWQPRARSVLLQGNVHNAVSNLFLFPGVFSSYEVFEPLPLIDPNFVAVFGLTSVVDALEQAGDVSIPALASLYLEEIQHRQAHGPYSLLGYSVGGVVAYEAARQLIERGEAVERIYLIDSPCPLAIPSIPQSLIRFIDTMTQAATLSESDSQHEASFKPMTYVPISLSPCPGHPIPKTTYYVAKHGLSPHAVAGAPNITSDEEAKALSWLLDDRKGLGASGDGWERLVDRTKLRIVALDADHLSIMADPHV
ncbi:Alpha/Beta hydrolase protein [Trichoderma barbatum]